MHMKVRVKNIYQVIFSNPLTGIHHRHLIASVGLPPQGIRHHEMNDILLFQTVTYRLEIIQLPLMRQTCFSGNK